MAFGKKNEVKLDILSYNTMLLGESGAGKTTLIKEVVEKYTGNTEAGLFLEIGQERGADAISGINYINCPEWEMEYDELTNSAGFWTVIEDIIENKTTEYPNLKVVIWDTVDQLISVVEDEAVRLWNKECREKSHPEKVTKTINSAWSGYGRGEKKAIELMIDSIAKLRSVGVATIIIGHVKTKQIDDALTGQSYQVLTSDQQQNYFSAIKKNLHFLGLLYVDREIAKEKTGKKDFNGKDKIVGKVKSESRRIRFRDDGSVVDCKSRFAEIVPEISCDADEFIKALTDAIMNEQKKSGKSVEETKAEQKAIVEAEEKRVAAHEEAAHTQKELDELKNEILTFFVNNKSNLDVIKPILEECKAKGYSNPKEIASIEDAKAILAMTLK